MTLRVFNVLGEGLAPLVDEVMGAGFRWVEFGARGFASGPYFYRLQAGNAARTKKMLLLR